MQICPKCKTTVVNNNKDCSSCGFEMDQIICSRCSAVLHMEADMCDSCGYFLGREFLVVAEGILSNEQLINERYRVLDSDENLVKDILPNHQTFYSNSLMDATLFNLYRKLGKVSAVPKIYDAFSSEGTDYILLKLSRDEFGQNLRTIKEAWMDFTDKEKLQIFRDWAYLFKLFSEDNAISSLFDTYNLFVDNDLNIKVKVLKTDKENEFTLKQLGKLWAGMVFMPNTTYLDYSKYKAGEIIRSLIDGRIDSVEILLEKLDTLLSRAATKLSHSALTNVGRKRTNNEDNFYASTLDIQENGFNHTYSGNRGLYIVCDGMGGHESGEVASANAVSSIRATILPALSFSLNFDDVNKLIQEAVVHQANEKVFQLNEQQNRQMEKRMGTTVVTAIVIDNKLYTAHVGDSRIYLITNDKMEQVTEDHNVAMKNYRDGVGSLEEALNNAKTNWGKVLTQAIGPKSSDSIYPEINSLNLYENCYLLLCSDGLTDMVEEQKIEDIVKEKWDSPEDVAEILINIANENGGKDNITVVAVRVEVVEPFFPAVDYADIYYTDEAYMNNEIIEMLEPQDAALEGLSVDPE